MKKIHLGIIGYGNMGSAHHRNILNGKCPEIEVTAIADSNPARLSWIKENIASPPALFSQAEEMMDSGLVDSVLVAVPHYDHPKYAIAAFRRGLHVMVEKPAGVYTKQVREMNEASENAGVVFGMMFNQRTNYIYRKMRDLVQSGTYGQLRRTNWLITNWYRPQAYYDSGDWRATWSGEGGGVLLNQCPHQLDLWQWICGMPVRVQAHMSFGRWHNIEVEDDVSAFVEYENGATGVFVTTTGDGLGSNRFEVQLDGAKLVAEDERLRVWELEPPEPEFSRTNTAPFAAPAGKGAGVRSHLGQSPAYRRTECLRRRDPARRKADRGRHRRNQRAAFVQRNASVRMDRKNSGAAVRRGALLSGAYETGRRLTKKVVT